jgi:hypothetical protein
MGVSVNVVTSKPSKLDEVFQVCQSLPSSKLMVKHWTWKSTGSPNPGATGRSMVGSNICSPLTLSTDTCKCSTISKRPHHKAVDVTKRNKMPAEHKCFECGGHKTWGMGKGAGPCAMHRYFECHSCFKVLTRDQKASHDELLDSTFMAGFDAAMAHVEKARTASGPLGLRED